MLFNAPELSFQYVPILSLSPSEMTAISELPEKDKDQILPLFPLKGWVGSKDLSRSIDRIEASIGKRKWIADIDSEFLETAREFRVTGKYPRQVYYDIASLLDSSSGYDNWVEFLKGIPAAIPVVQLDDLSQLVEQLDKLRRLERGIVVRLLIERLGTYDFDIILSAVQESGIEDIYVIFDYGDVSRESLAYIRQYSALLQKYSEVMPRALYSISCTSFPYGFPGAAMGELPIYERQIFRKVKNRNINLRMVYSDRGSARAGRMSGGSGTPPPRIDYPLKDDWRFVRKEFDDSSNIADGEKERLYFEIASNIVSSEYWLKDLHLWGTQLIELTSKGDEYGINSASKATAVRINIHLYVQLHYDDVIEDLSTDEDWED